MMSVIVEQDSEKRKVGHDRSAGLFNEIPQTSQASESLWPDERLRKTQILAGSVLETGVRPAYSVHLSHVDEFVF